MKNVVKKTFVLMSVIFAQSSFGQAIFQGYDMAVSNPAGVVAAMDRFMASPTAQAFTGSVFLYQYIANGESEATHNILVVHNSPEELNQSLAAQATSLDSALFLTEMNQAAQVVNTNIGQILASSGTPVTSTNRAGMWYFLSVEDPATYASAWTAMAEANQESGQAFLSSSIADGENPTTHIAVNWFSSPGEALMNQPQTYNGWERFSSSVRDIRTIEGTAMVQLVKSWNSQ